MAPLWLPEILELHGASIDEDYRQLHEVFVRDFIDSRPAIDGKYVFCEPAKDKQNPTYTCGFTHLITHDDGTGQRFIDYNRACRLPWVRAIIDNYKRPEVSVFYARQANKKYGVVNNLYLWLEECSFVVILREVKRGRMDGKLLVTAYDTSNWTNKKLARLRNEYRESKKRP